MRMNSFVLRFSFAMPSSIASEGLGATGHSDRPLGHFEISHCSMLFLNPSAIGGVGAADHYIITSLYACSTWNSLAVFEPVLN